MDQSASRSLLSSGQGTSSSSSSHPKSKSRGVLGGPAPKRGTPGTAGGGAWGIKVKPGNEYRPPPTESSTGFAPRNQHKRKYGEAKEGDGKYMDRAERRRKGLDDEYKPVEQLLEDLEKRQQEEGVDEKEIERQRAYLGGDATHSILVKGLDYALLARTKAELAAKEGEVADEELDELAKGVTTKTKPVKADPKPEEKLAKGFKSISAKEETKTTQSGEKKKKKKKKVKPEDTSSVTQVMEEAAAGPSRPKSPDSAPAPPKVEAKTIVTKPVDDDDDIFGDAGAYDLTAGRVDEDDSEEEEEEGEEAEVNRTGTRRGASHSSNEDGASPRRRFRSPSYDKHPRADRSYRDRSRSRSRDRYDHRDRSSGYRRERSYSRERYDGRRGERSYSRESYHGRDRYRGDDRDRNRRERSDSRDYNDRRRDYSHGDRDSYGRRDGRSARGYHENRDRSYSPYRRSIRRDSPRSPRRSPSVQRATRSPSPDAKRPRRATRSPSPIRFDYNPRAASLTPSDESEDEHLVGGKLQPLQSSALADVKGYLSLDAKAAADEERKARKAKWRARQGMGVQEGTEKYLEREVGDAEKANRDYVNLMSKLKKEEPAKG